MTSFRDLDALLEARGRFRPGDGPVPWWALARIAGAAGAVAGLVLGARSGHPAQMLLTAVKVPLLILVSTALALPSLLVANTVVGLRADLRAVLRGILASQATVALALAALAPLLALFFASTDDYALAKLVAGALFLAASLAGQRTLAAHYGPLVHADARHRIGRRLWWFLYALVTIQLAWLLRPFLGSPDLPFQLLRDEAWGNAYVEIGRLLRGLLRGR